MFVYTWDRRAQMLVHFTKLVDKDTISSRKIFPPSNIKIFKDMQAD